MIEKHTIQVYRVNGCDLDFSYNEIKITDTATGDVMRVEGIDWRELKRAMGEYYSTNASNSSGVEWFRNSARYWNTNDLEALQFAVAGAIASKKAEAKA